MKKAKGVDEVVGDPVQKQAEGVSQKAVAAQTVSTEAVLQFFDAALTLSAIVAKSKDLRSGTRKVGNEKPKVSSDRSVLGFVADTPLA